MQKGSADVSHLIAVFEQLRNDYGFEEVRIIIGAGLRHKVETTEFDRLRTRFEEEKRKTGHGVLHQAPAGINDDDFIIDHAVKENYLILTNDLYRDYQEKHPEMKCEVQGRLVKYMIIDDKLRIVSYPS